MSDDTAAVRGSSATVRIGVVGLGRMGRRHAENFATRVPRAEVVAVCSPIPADLEWARTRLGGVACCRDYGELLRLPELDAVVLATPTTLHAVQIEQGIAAGKHVFCEKPLSLDLADCERVQRAAAARPQLQVMIGYVRRFDASYRDAHARIARGQIGTPFLVRSQTCDRLDPSGAFVQFAASSGGLFLDCSVHDIDLARWLLGAPRLRRVYAAGTDVIYHGLREFNDIDNGLGVCEFQDGKMACFYASRTMAHGHETWTEIVGSAGKLTVGLSPRANRVEMADELGVRFEVLPDFYARFSEAFVEEAIAFVAAVRGEAPSPLTLADATEATRIGHLLARAQREHQVIEVHE